MPKPTSTNIAHRFMPELEQQDESTTATSLRRPRACPRNNKESKPFFLHACVQRHRRTPYTTGGKTTWSPLIESTDSTPKCLFLINDGEMEEYVMTLKDFFTTEDNTFQLGMTKHEVEWLQTQRNNRAFSVNDECISGETPLCDALKDMHVKINLYV